jgi:hypothetical protein
MTEKDPSGDDRTEQDEPALDQESIRDLDPDDDDGGDVRGGRWCLGSCYPS